MDQLTRTQYDWQLKHIDKSVPIIGAILGQKYIKPSSAYQDKHHAMDLILYGETGAIAHRIRKSDALPWWPNFTIRAWLASGARTEMNKLLEEEHVTYGFYAILSVDESTITHFLMYDMVLFRKFFRELPLRFNVVDLELFLQSKGMFVSEVKKNKDDCTGFVSFDADELNKVMPGIITARKRSEKQRRLGVDRKLAI